MKPIRVLNLFTIMNRGGAETMVMNLYRQIDRAKVQFDFMVYHQERGSYDDEIESLGGKIYRFPMLRPHTLLKYKRCLRAFFKEHTEYKIVHGHMGEIGYYVYKEASKQGVPVIIVHSHGANPTIAGIEPYIRFKRVVRGIFTKMMWKYVTDGFACGYTAREELFGKGNISAIIINNAIDAKKYSYDSGIARQMKVKLGIENKYVIGNVGRLNFEKNHVFMIDIFKCIHDKNPNSVLLLVGDGVLRSKIEQKSKALQLEDSIIFAGVRPDIPELMQAMDVFLFPSLFEGLPLAVIEAQAAGLPCVLSDTVPKETNITDLCEFISLTETPAVWAERILRYQKNFNRGNKEEEIKKAGYDVKVTAGWLQQYYLNKHAEFEDIK
jgi:glycosyltransferase involved in cell wall biosynthesis